MNGFRVPLKLACTFRTLGRAMIGALAGLIVVPLTLIIATEYFRLHLFEDSVQGDRLFWQVSGLGIVVSALLAAISGKAEFRGRTGAAIKGALAGAMAGVVAGATLGPTAVPGMPQKAGIILGIFLGGPLGGIVGGIIGAYLYKYPAKGPFADDQ